MRNWNILVVYPGFDTVSVFTLPMRNWNIFYLDVDDKLRTHRVDFSINNILVEIKSEYTYNADVNIENKRLWAIFQGYEYVLVIDKDYFELENILFF